MAGTVNKVIIIGNLTRDPEIRTMQNGGKLANVSVATNDTWKDKTTGERREKAEYHRVVIFDERLVDVAEKYLAKGSKVYLEGELQTRKWQQDGQDRYSTEVVLQRFRSTLTMLDDAPKREARDPQAPTGAEQTAADNMDRRGGNAGNDLGDIPF